MGLLEGRRGVAETHPLPSPPLEGEGVNSRGFGRLLQTREPELLALRQVALGHRLRQLAHAQDGALALGDRSEEHTSELQSLMRISYAVFCLKKKKVTTNLNIIHTDTTYTKSAS